MDKPKHKRKSRWKLDLRALFTPIRFEFETKLSLEDCESALERLRKPGTLWNFQEVEITRLSDAKYKFRIAKHFQRGAFLVEAIGRLEQARDSIVMVTGSAEINLVSHIWLLLATIPGLAFLYMGITGAVQGRVFGIVGGVVVIVYSGILAVSLLHNQNYLIDDLEDALFDT